jgi:ketosteroid isomerase-like protein
MKEHVGIFFFVVCGLALLVLGCNQKQKHAFDLTAMKQIIEEKNNQFTNAHITGDGATIDKMLTQDARSFPPNADAAIGRAAIAALTSEYLKLGIKEFREETTALYGNEDYVIDEGNYVIRYGNDNTIEKGKYVNVWKHVDGDWKLYSNIWNSNMPATPTK